MEPFETDLRAEWGVDVPDSRPSEKAEDYKDLDNKYDEQYGSGEIVPVQGQEQGQRGSNGVSAEKAVMVRSWLSERQAGVYVRTFYLPAAVKTDGIQARLSQGLLKIMVPKMDESLFNTKDIYIATAER